MQTKLALKQFGKITTFALPLLQNESHSNKKLSLHHDALFYCLFIMGIHNGNNEWAMKGSEGEGSDVQAHVTLAIGLDTIKKKDGVDWLSQQNQHIWNRWENTPQEQVVTLSLSRSFVLCREYFQIYKHKAQHVSLIATIATTLEITINCAQLNEMLWMQNAHMHSSS